MNDQALFNSIFLDGSIGYDVAAILFSEFIIRNLLIKSLVYTPFYAFSNYMIFRINQQFLLPTVRIFHERHSY